MLTHAMEHSHVVAPSRRPIIPSYGVLPSTTLPSSMRSSLWAWWCARTTRSSWIASSTSWSAMRSTSAQPQPWILAPGVRGEGLLHHEAAKVSSDALHLRGTLQAAGLSRETHGSVRSPQADNESERAEPCTSTHGGYRSELERGGCFSGLLWHGGPFLNHGA